MVRRRSILSAIETLEFRRLLSGYVLQDTLTPPSPTVGGQFGATLATSNDLALVYSAKADFSGEVDLIDTASGQLLHTFANPTPTVNSQFGYSAAFVGDKIAISSPYGVGADPGEVFIYDANFDLQLTILAPTTEQTQFGRSLAALGDDLLIGVPQPDGNQAGPGQIWRVDTTTGVTEQVYSDSYSLPGVADGLGTLVTVDGNVIYTGVVDYTTESPQLVVLALDATSGSIVETFSQPENPDPGSAFGSALGVDPASHNLFVGAGAIDTVYEFASDGTPIRSYAGAEAGEGFGYSLAVSAGKLAVGSQSAITWLDESTGMYNGKAYIFDTATGSIISEIANPTPEYLPAGAADAFGTALGALPDGKFLISDPFDDAAGEDAGAVYVFGEEQTSTNTAPTAGAIAGQAAGVRQQELSFAASFTDPDAGDTHFFSWDFGDGTTIADGALDATHAYTASGTYTVTFTVRDAAGAESSSTFVVNITAAGLQDGTLYVGGTTGANDISISPGTGGRVVLNLDGVLSTYSAAKIVILGGDGADTVQVAGSIQLPVLVLGGAGDDSIKGGAGNDTIVGGDGEDLLLGGSGRDLIIGGRGADRIVGNTDDDILVAGTTAFFGDLDALAAIGAEWTSARTYAQRVANLRDGSGTADRLNGGYFLTADVTTYDDGARDILTGSQGQDWFIFNADGTVPDKVTDLSSSEFADDLDFIGGA